MALVRILAWIVCLLPLVGAVLGDRSLQELVVEGLKSLGEDLCHILVLERTICCVPRVVHNIFQGDSFFWIELCHLLEKVLEFL